MSFCMMAERFLSKNQVVVTDAMNQPLVPLSIETPRLRLRMFEESDWDALCQMFEDEECVQYTRGQVQPKWETWRILAAYLGHWSLRGYGPYAVVEKSSEKMMGPVGLWCPGDWPEPEIKYSLTRAFWGNGYASEAALAVKEMAKKDLGWRRLISLIARENSNSIAVAKRIGGVFEKTIPFRGGEAEIYAYHL